jgi:NAD-dependent dihydropyrimidine dehydrogenase PreA subunit
VKTGNQLNKTGLSVPSIVIEYGSLFGKMKTLPFLGHYMAGCLLEAKKSVKSIQKNEYLGKKRISRKDKDDLNHLIKELNVSDYGTLKLEQKHLFRNSKILFEHALIFTLEMKRDKIDTSPSIVSNKEIFRTYYELGVVVNKISDFLRSRGYNAQPIPALSNYLNLVYCARDAGLGEFGKHGLLITEQFGPSLRLAAVVTDIENFDKKDNDHQWVREFCETCPSCVNHCPANAIYEQPRELEDGTFQSIDYKKCAVPFSTDYGCTICIRECTFYKVDYQKLKKSHEKRKYYEANQDLLKENLN